MPVLKLICFSFIIILIYNIFQMAFILNEEEILKYIQEKAAARSIAYEEVRIFFVLFKRLCLKPHIVLPYSTSLCLEIV